MGAVLVVAEPITDVTAPVSPKGRKGGNDATHAMETPTGYSISTDKRRLDVDTIHGFLAGSYWSPGIPRSVLERAIENSLCFGVFHGSEQVGFARVITDRATFAYLADVFILEPHRGKSLSKCLMQAIREHDDLQGLRRFLLATRDAHGLYRQFGFGELASASHMMEILKPDVYRQVP